MLRKFFGKSDHYDINQVQFAFPCMGIYNTIFHQVNVFQTIFRHIHTYPDGIDSLDIIIIWIWKISFFLWRNHSTHIKDCPIQYIVPIRFVLLGFYINNNLRQSIPHPDIEYNVKSYHSLMKFRVFRIKTNHTRFIIFNNSISKTCFYWNSVNKWFAFNIRNHIFRIHPCKFINSLY